MKVTELATCINLYENAFDSREFMHEVNEESDNEWSEIQWTVSSTGVGIVGNHRTSAEVDISHLEHIESVMANKFKPICKTLLEEVVGDYAKEYLVSVSMHEGWRLLKYSGGGEYHAHYDHAPRNERIVSIVAFLETPEIGGELEFPFFGVTVPAIAGNAVVFPSNFPYVHIAHPVASGTKCSLVTWFK